MDPLSKPDTPLNPTQTMIKIDITDKPHLKGFLERVLANEIAADKSESILTITSRVPTEAPKTKTVVAYFHSDLPQMNLQISDRKFGTILELKDVQEVADWTRNYVRKMHQVETKQGPEAVAA